MAGSRLDTCMLSAGAMCSSGCFFGKELLASSCREQGGSEPLKETMMPHGLFSCKLLAGSSGSPAKRGPKTKLERDFFTRTSTKRL